MNHFLLQPLNEASLPRQPLAPATGAGVQATRHAVEPGQSMEDIAGIHGVTEHALRQANDLGPGQAVYPGTLLRVPEQASPGPDSGELASTAALRPVAPDTDGGAMGELTWVPDFKSMSPAEIRAFLRSPEFKQMAASEREVAQRLYDAGMKQAAAEYLAGRMKDMPPEVAARLAEECREFIGQLARDAAGDKKMHAAFAEMASLLLESPRGAEVLRQFARGMAGAMTDQQAREFLRTIHEGAPGGQPLKILVLKALLARAEEGTLKSVQAQELRNAITEQVKEVYQAYRSAQAAKTAKDQEFLALLARVGGSLTDKQKQDLYRKFMSDPDNSGVYEKAAKTAAALAKMISVAARETVAVLLNGFALSDIPALIDDLSSYGQGVAALKVLLAVKATPGALAALERTGVDASALERKAAASALAQSTLENGNDVKSGLNALFEALKGSFDDVDGVIGKLEKLLRVFPEGRSPTVDELTEILGQAGPLRNLVGGLLSMAIALTAPTPESFEESMGVLLDFGAATVDTTRGIVAILGHFASENGRFASVLESAAAKLKFLGGVLGVLLSSKSVLDSIQSQMEQGEVNCRDMFNIASGMLAIAAAFPTPATPFLALAAVIVAVVGEIVSNVLEEQEMQAQIKKYLGQLGFDEAVAAVIAAKPEAIEQLVAAGFSPEQVVALARQFPDVLSGRYEMLGLGVLIDALRNTGLAMDEIMALLSGLEQTGLQHVLNMIVKSPERTAQLGRVHDSASLVDALGELARRAPTEEARAVIGKMLDRIRSRHP